MSEKEKEEKLLECIKAFKLKYHIDYVNTKSQKFKQFQYKWKPRKLK